MARVIITTSLEDEINARFKRESVKVISLLKTLEDNPKKGDPVGHVGAVVIKEIRYASVYRFYFVAEGHKIKFLKPEELADLIIKFVRMSDKDTQQKVIEEIKTVLKRIGPTGFD